MISKGKKVIRSIHGGSLSLCECRQARIKGPAGHIWPVSGLQCTLVVSEEAFRTEGETSKMKKFASVERLNVIKSYFVASQIFG